VIKGNSGSQIPRGWVRSKIGEVCTLVNGRAFKPSEWSSKGLPIIRIQNLNNPDAEFNYCDFTVEQKYYVDYGQLLFAWSGTPETSFGAHIWRRGKAVLNQHIFKVEIDERFIDKSFFMHLINYNVTEYIRKAHGTAGLAHITKGKFEDSFVAIPPFNEQVRIVARLEELFTRLDAGIEGLRKVKAQLKRYRQAVLKYAFEGKLTEEWRKTHRDQIEPATKLLERIKQERKQKLGTKYKELPPIDTSQLPQLPQGWTWTRPGEFAQINPGFPCGKHNKDKKGIPHIRPMNIDVNGKIDLSDVKYVHCLTYDALLKGDVLFNNTNSPELLGKTAYIEENTNWAYSNHMTRLRFNTYLLDSAYISYYLHNLFLSGFFKINCVHHVNQASINSGFLSERVVIALPSLDEQHRIAEEIKLRQSVAEDTGKAIEESLMRAERLRQGILKMAFEGRLIPQDPGDEAADKLLERIKAERAKSKGEKDINKKKNKPKQLELSAYVE
jgi:type I restriction enzyme S subunit